MASTLGQLIVHMQYTTNQITTNSTRHRRIPQNSNVSITEMTGKVSLLSSSNDEDVPLVEFMYLVFTRMSGESYRRRLRLLLLRLCEAFRALINSIVC